MLFKASAVDLVLWSLAESEEHCAVHVVMVDIRLGSAMQCSESSVVQRDTATLAAWALK